MSKLFKHCSPYLVILFFVALIAALGNVPYAYRFAKAVLPSVQPYLVIVGILFAMAATLANTILGTYSLLKIRDTDTKNRRKIIAVSFAGAIPIGFICFFGYQSIIPLPLNLLISCTVTIVNSAIGFIAISGLLDDSKQLKKYFTDHQYLFKHAGEISLKTLGFLLGICMSLVGYIAAANGMKLLFTNYGWSGAWSSESAYIIALLAWIPFATLYANSTQKLFGKIHQQFEKFKTKHERNTIYFSAANIFIITFVLLSGTSLTQIAIELFSPSNNIPEIFKQTNVQLLINYGLIPITFISVSAVNYLALNNFVRYIKENPSKLKHF